MILYKQEVVCMATDTFYKRVVLSDEAAEQLANGLEKPREPYKPKRNMLEVLRMGEEWLQQKISDSDKLSAQTRN
jgi:hypothetical protein